MSEKTLVANQNEITKVDISLLRPSEYNLFDTDDIDDLVVSIKALGLLSALTVVGPDADGCYEILSGERRYKAIMRINSESGSDMFMREIPCHIIGPANMPAIEKELAIEESNLESRDDYNRETHRFHVISLYKKIADEGTISERNIVRYVGQALKLSKRYSVMYMSVFRDGVPELIDAVQSENKEPGADAPVHIPVSPASRIAKMEPEVQRSVIERINAGEKRDDVIRDVIGHKDDRSDSGFDVIAGNSGSYKYDSLLDEDEIENEPEMVEDMPDVVSSDHTEPSDLPGIPVLHDAPQVEPEPQPPKGNGQQAPSISPKVQSSMSDEDMDVINAALTQPMLDGDMDVLGYMQRKINYGNLDLSIDTTNGLSNMRTHGSSDSSNIIKNERKHVVAWIKRISNSLIHDETLDDEDAELLLQIQSLELTI